MFEVGCLSKPCLHLWKTIHAPDIAIRVFNLNVIGTCNKKSILYRNMKDSSIQKCSINLSAIGDNWNTKTEKDQVQ